jgi:glutamate carboxypeptidase
MLKKIVDINSGTTNIAGVKKVGNILSKQFRQLGFKTTWINEPASMKRAGTLVATHQGKNPQTILLIGHLDTVFPNVSTFKKMIIHQHTATGPGVVDIKGGDIVILYALKALKNSHALDDATITVVLTGDEEDSGKPAAISRKPLFDAAKNAAVALDFEAASSLTAATIARRGIASWTITTHGDNGHSSSIFRGSGDGAIFELARILNTMRDQLSHEKYLSFSPGIILGGTTVSHDLKNFDGHAYGKDNVIAKTATASGDLRFLTEQQKNTAEKTISTIVTEHLPETHAAIIFQDGIPSMEPTDNNLALLTKYSEVSVDLGGEHITAYDPDLRGAGDISYIAGMVPANLAGLGALGSDSHSEKETLELNSLPIQTERAAILLFRLTQALQSNKLSSDTTP